MEKKIRKLSSSQIIIIGFAAVILVGSILLMLPWATNDRAGASFADAVFTATSAVCVTGLVVKDTAAYWSGFGQLIILLLIQVGGMGVVTAAVSINMILGKRISLKQRSTMQDAISAPQVGGIIKFIGFILKITFISEAIGAVILTYVFKEEMGFLKGLWYGIFHSVSAFCNAGFDLMGFRSHFSSLSHYAGNPIVNIIIMLLIIVGGIGFMTWYDIRTNHIHLRKYKVQSKVILSTTAVLIILPTIYFFFMEFSEYALGERILGSMFQAVTPRTAGFNTLDLTLISETGLALMIVLMLIGGSPGSTAGGMKTTTLAVMISTAISVFRQREHTHFFGRRVTGETVRNASTILMMYLTLFLGGGLIISRLENLALLDCLFETASAVGTVGLTLGITPELGGVSRCILILLMYCGRVGGLTLIFATVTKKNCVTAKLPQEKITVG